MPDYRFDIFITGLAHIAERTETAATEQLARQQLEIDLIANPIAGTQLSQLTIVPKTNNP